MLLVLQTEIDGHDHEKVLDGPNLATSPSGVGAVALMLSTSSRLQPASSRAKVMAWRPPSLFVRGRISRRDPRQDLGMDLGVDRPCAKLADQNGSLHPSGPSRSRSNGRDASVGDSLRAVDMAFMAPNEPMHSGVIEASEPPATITSARPSRMRSQAERMLWPPVAHAVPMAEFGPFNPCRMEMLPAALFSMTRHGERADPS